jgi:2-polyprenyl-6-methoxyphenol hydroxylase-like FAD-dependent oxidoreductase
MKVGIIGSGRIGGTLAFLITRLGHDVLVGSRNPATKVALEARLTGRGRVLRSMPLLGSGISSSLPRLGPGSLADGRPAGAGPASLQSADDGFEAEQLLAELKV